MGRGKKSQCRGLADFVADFGVLPGPLDYETYVGLALNADRVRLRKAYYAALAAGVAASQGDIAPAMVRAACDSDAEAKRLAFEINAARQRAKQGWE